MDILEIFRKTGALMNGHFLLSSGLHSDKYLQCALVLQNPVHAEELCRRLASNFKTDKPTVVLAPALGGIIVSYEVARVLGIRGIFAERVDGKMVLRRNFGLEEKDRVLVVEDVVTTGGSTKELLDIVKESGAKLIGVGALVDRSGRVLDFGVKFASLLKIDLPSYMPEQCFLCREGKPVVKPGSRL